MRLQTPGRSALPQALCAQCLTPGTLGASEHTIKQPLLMGSAAKGGEGVRLELLGSSFLHSVSSFALLFDSVPTSSASTRVTAFFPLLFSLYLRADDHRIVKFPQYFKLDF